MDNLVQCCECGQYYHKDDIGEHEICDFCLYGEEEDNDSRTGEIL